MVIEKGIMNIVCFISLLFSWLICPLETNPTIHQEEKYDVILILGIIPNQDCTPSEIMTQRMQKGVELYNKGLAPKLLLSGGNSIGECIESEIMFHIANSLGVPDSCLIMESNSANTYQNAYYSVQIMNDLNLKSALIVTSDFHEKRVQAIFSNYDISYKVYTIEDSSNNMKKWLWHIREFFILLYHRLFGYSPSFGLKS